MRCAEQCAARARCVVFDSVKELSNDLLVGEAVGRLLDRGQDMSLVMRNFGAPALAVSSTIEYGEARIGQQGSSQPPVAQPRSSFLSSFPPPCATAERDLEPARTPASGLRLVATTVALGSHDPHGIGHRVNVGKAPTVRQGASFDPIAHQAADVSELRRRQARGLSDGLTTVMPACKRMRSAGLVLRRGRVSVLSVRG